MSRKRTAKAVSAKKANVFELSQALVNNSKAWEEGPKRKSWSKHDLRTIRPLTAAQEDMFHAYMNDYSICGYGTAGTGKSFLAMYLALNDLLDDKSNVDYIVIVRSIVSTRTPGFLPGTLAEKIAPFEVPYMDILYELTGKSSTYKDMKEAGLIRFMPTSFVRGTTWNNAAIIVDEVQNMNDEEIDSVMTRVGKDSKLFVLGDNKRQNDLQYSRSEKSGMDWFLKVVELMPEFAMVQFLPQDVVRGEFVKSWILAGEELMSQNKGSK